MKLSKSFLLFALVLSFMSLSSSSSDAASRGKIRVGVLHFESKADGVSQSQAAIVTDLFTRELAQSKTIAVYEREQIQKIGEEIRRGMSGLVDVATAVEVGKIKGLQYILLGSITELSQKAGGGGFGGLASAKHEAKATIDMRVIDVATSEVRLALRAEGTSKNEGWGVSVGGVTFLEGEFGGIEARAIADAVVRLGHDVRGELGGESSHVIGVTSDGFAVNVSAKEGTLYLVYVDGKSIIDMDGTVIGRDKIPLAVLKVRDSSSGHSICTVAPQGGKGDLIKRGDKIEPITSKKAKELANAKKFPKERPRASSGTFEDIFGDGNGKKPKAEPNGSAPAGIEDFDELDEEPPQPVKRKPSNQAPAGEARTIPGFDPNESTDAKVIDTYPLSSTERNALGIKHRGAYNLYSKKRYKDAYAKFSEAAYAFGGNYLSAYWAGVAATRMKNEDYARTWFKKALSINPAYTPAKEALEKLDDTDKPAKKKKKRA